jgi:predicted Na+-dependent transporter
MVLVGTAPGGTASNVVTLLSRGDVALSVAVTSASTFFAPLMTPILTLWLIGTAVDVDAPSLLLSILQIVILPVALGLTLNTFFRRRVDPFRPVLPLLSVLAIMLIVAFVIGANWSRFQMVGAALVAAVMAHNLIGLALGTVTLILSVHASHLQHLQRPAPPDRSEDAPGIPSLGHADVARDYCCGVIAIECWICRAYHPLT